jgi:hypothetical protein
MGGDEELVAELEVEDGLDAASGLLRLQELELLDDLLLRGGQHVEVVEHRHAPARHRGHVGEVPLEVGRRERARRFRVREFLLVAVVPPVLPPPIGDAMVVVRGGGRGGGPRGVPGDAAAAGGAEATGAARASVGVPLALGAVRGVGQALARAKAVVSVAARVRVVAPGSRVAVRLRAEIQISEGHLADGLLRPDRRGGIPEARRNCVRAKRAKD